MARSEANPPPHFFLKSVLKSYAIFSMTDLVDLGPVLCLQLDFEKRAYDFFVCVVLIFRASIECLC